MGKFISLTILLFVTACSSGPSLQPSAIQESRQLQGTKQKVSDAFENANALKAKHSSWFNERKEKLPLTIVAIAYIDNEAAKTYEYRTYKKLLKEIEKDITLLDRLSGQNISSKYSSINFVDYAESDNYKNKFNAAYANQHSDKEVLTDVLRPDVEKPSAELLIRLNFEELKKGNLTIEGYKTLKESNKERNSYYYTLRKTGYTKLSKKDKNKSIVNSLLATLQLSIPEYVSIDRKEFVKDGSVLRFITSEEDGTYTGRVYKHQSDENVSKVEADINAVKKKDWSTKVVTRSKGDSVVLSSNGKYILYTDLQDKYVKDKGQYKSKYIYMDLHSGRIISSLEGGYSYTEYGRPGALSKDGKYALSADTNGILIYWELENKRVIKKFNADEAYFGGVTISEDGRYALSSSWGELRYWDLNKGKKIRSLEVEGVFTIAVAISPNGKYALSGGKGGALLYWNLKSGKLVKTLKGHKGDIYAVIFSKDGKVAYSGSNDKTIRSWSLASGKNMNTFSGHSGYVRALSLSEDGNYLLSGSGDNTLRYWDLNTGKTIQIFRGHTEAIYSASISPNGKFVVSGSFDETVRYWELSKTKEFERKVDSLKKEISNIKKLSKQQARLGRQNILTTNLNLADVKILKDTDFIKNKAYKMFSLKDVNDISNVLNYEYADPMISYNFNDIYQRYSNIDTSMIGEILLIKKRPMFSLPEIYFTSRVDFIESGYKQIKTLENIDINTYNSNMNSDISSDIELTNSIGVLGPNSRYLKLTGVSETLFGDFKREEEYFDLVKGEKINSFPVSSGNYKVYDVGGVGNDQESLSQQSKYKISITGDGVLVFWDLELGKKVKTFEFGGFNRGRILISENGRFGVVLYGGGSDNDKIYYLNLGLSVMNAQY